MVLIFHQHIWLPRHMDSAKCECSCYTKQSKEYSTLKNHKLFSKEPTVTLRSKNKVLKLATSFCICQFHYSCGASYICRRSKDLLYHNGQSLIIWLSKVQCILLLFLFITIITHINSVNTWRVWCAVTLFHFFLLNSI